MSLKYTTKKTPYFIKYYINQEIPFYKLQIAIPNDEYLFYQNAVVNILKQKSFMNFKHIRYKKILNVLQKTNKQLSKIEQSCQWERDVLQTKKKSYERLLNIAGVTIYLTSACTDEEVVNLCLNIETILATRPPPNEFVGGNSKLTAHISFRQESLNGVYIPPIAFGVAHQKNIELLEQQQRSSIRYKQIISLLERKTRTIFI